MGFRPDYLLKLKIFKQKKKKINMYASVFKKNFFSFPFYFVTFFKQIHWIFKTYMKHFLFSKYVTHKPQTIVFVKIWWKYFYGRF